MFNEEEGRRPATWAPRLMVRPDAQEYQNRQDYLMRVAAGNRLNGISDLCQVLNTDFSTLVSLPDKAINKFFNGVPLERIAVAGSPRYTHPGLARKGLGSRTRICPQCIVEGLPLDAYFNFALPVPCRKHKLMPVDRCPECLNPINYFRKAIEACDCGFYFANCGRVLPPQWLPMFFSNFAPWHISLLFPESFTELAIRNDESGRLISLLLTDPTLAAPRRRRRNSWVSLSDFVALESLISGWPESFEPALTSHLANSTRSQKALLLKRLKGCGSSVLQDLVDSVVRQRSAEKKRLKMTEVTGIPNAVSPSSLRKLAKLDAAATRTLLEHDLGIDGYACDERENNRRWVNEEKAQFLLDYLASTISLGDAAKILDCSQRYVRALVKFQWLNAETLDAKPRSPRFKPEIIDKWLEKMRLRSFPIKQAKGPTIPLSLIPAYSVKSNVRKSWATLFPAILDDRVLLFSSSHHPRLSELHVQASDLLKYGMRKHDLIRLTL
jgi:hypothetical protein